MVTERMDVAVVIIIYTTVCYLSDCSVCGLDMKIAIDGTDITKDLQIDTHKFDTPLTSLEVKAAVDKQKRSSMFFEKKGKRCLIALERLKKKKKLAVSATAGEEVSLTCHYCGDPEATVHKGMLWYRIGHMEETSHGYPVIEVEIDMHDEEWRNRVVVSTDHTLQFRKSKASDTGLYFCQNTDKEETLKHIHSEKIEHIMTSSESFNVLYHLDVLRRYSKRIKEVMATGSDYPRPAPPQSFGFLSDEFVQSIFELLWCTPRGQTRVVPGTTLSKNIKLLTDWGPWSECNVCGKIGERRRQGTCKVTKLRKAEPVSSWQLNEFMTMYADGVPCRSFLFADVYHVEGREDEIELQECRSPCKSKDGNAKKLDSWNRVNHAFNSPRFKTKVIKKKITTVIGEFVQMVCPGASLDTAVAWMNGSRYISRVHHEGKTKPRYEVDAMNSLSIHTAKLYDSATYSCWYHGEKKAEIILSVDGTLDVDDVWLNATYLAMSYLVDLCIFLVMMMIRHKNRRVQVKIRRSKAKMSKQNVVPENLDSLSSTATSSAHSLHESRTGDEISRISGRIKSGSIKRLELSGTGSSPGLIVSKISWSGKCNPSVSKVDNGLICEPIVSQFMKLGEMKPSTGHSDGECRSTTTTSLSLTTTSVTSESDDFSPNSPGRK